MKMPLKERFSGKAAAVARTPDETGCDSRVALAGSQRELARRIGRSQAAVGRWIHDDRWPFPRVPPWDVRLVAKWMLTHLESGIDEDEERRLIVLAQR
jgi:hypothetical protein